MDQAGIVKKWAGTEFLGEERYWDDVLVWLKAAHNDVMLPLEYNTMTVRLVQSLLDCRDCSECCRYPRVDLTDFDLFRFRQNGITVPAGRLGKSPDGMPFMSASGGCSFLRGDKCSIYRLRPDMCWMYPAQVHAINGKDMLYLRVICRPALEVLKIIIRDAVAGGGCRVTPDLRLTGG